MNTRKSTTRQFAVLRTPDGGRLTAKVEDRRQKSVAAPARLRLGAPPRRAGKSALTGKPCCLSSVLCSLFYALCALMLAGCMNQQRGEPTLAGKPIEQVCAADLQKQQAMQIAEDVLAEMYFTIDKADAERGYIETKPLPGAQFFEFWRSDNIGAFSSAEANLHSIRRVAQLTVGQQDEELCISCDVRVYRLNMPESAHGGISSSSHAYQMFSESVASIQKLKISPEQEEGSAWLDLGEDELLASEILRRIERRVIAYRLSQIAYPPLRLAICH
jgi:hypothetical protein